MNLFACAYVDALSGGAFFDNENLEKARRDYVEEMEGWLDAQAAELRDAGIDTSTRVKWHKPRYEAVLEHARDTDADLIICATSGRGKLERLLEGGTEWDLIRHATQILWLVKSDRAADDGMRILAAVDPAHHAEDKAGLDRRLLETADDLRRWFSGHLHVFHAYMPITTEPIVQAGTPVVPATGPIPRVDSATMEKLRENRRQQVEDLCERYDVPEERIHVVAGDTTAMIQELVDSEGIDVVVAGAISRGWLQRLLIGSTAERFLDAVDCDFVVVKPPGFNGG